MVESGLFLTIIVCNRTASATRWIIGTGGDRSLMQWSSLDYFEDRMQPQRASCNLLDESGLFWRSLATAVGIHSSMVESGLRWRLWSAAAAGTRAWTPSNFTTRKHTVSITRSQHPYRNPMAESRSVSVIIIYAHECKDVTRDRHPCDYCEECFRWNKRRDLKHIRWCNSQPASVPRSSGVTRSWYPTWNIYDMPARRWPICNRTWHPYSDDGGGVWFVSKNHFRLEQTTFARNRIVACTPREHASCQEPVLVCAVHRDAAAGLRVIRSFSCERNDLQLVMPNLVVNWSFVIGIMPNLVVNWSFVMAARSYAKSIYRKFVQHRLDVLESNEWDQVNFNNGVFRMYQRVCTAANE